MSCISIDSNLIVGKVKVVLYVNDDFELTSAYFTARSFGGLGFGMGKTEKNIFLLLLCTLI